MTENPETPDLTITHDTYVGGKGFDALDLSKYNADEVTFSIKGKHVLIETPDGTIKLKNQIKKNFDTGKVMEEIIFADGTLDEAAIKARAENDGTPSPVVVSGTSGNDVIDATYAGDPDGDVITDAGNIISAGAGAGNDKVQAGDGDDTFVYTSGNDIYGTGKGFDTLDLSQYNMDEVSVRFYRYVSEVVMEIETPDGNIRIQDQGSLERYNADGSVRVDGSLGFESFVFADKTVSEEEFNLLAITSQGTDGSDSIRGADNTAGVFDSGAGNDRLYGGDSDDTFIYTSGNDQIFGGGGNDVIDLSKYSSDEVRIFAAGEGGSIGKIVTPDGIISASWGFGGEVGYDLKFSDVTLSGTDVEDQMNLVFGSYKSEVVDADFVGSSLMNSPSSQVSEGDDIIASEGGDDVVYGYGGDDTFIYRGGDDTYIGGEGEDILFVKDATAWIDEVTVTRVGNTDSMLINIDFAPGNSITIAGGMGVNSEDTIETFIFGDQIFTQQEMIDMIA